MYYLWRLTPDDRWMVYDTAHDPLPAPDEIAAWEQVLVIPGCDFYAEACAERDRMNGTGDGRQGELGI